MSDSGRLPLDRQSINPAPAVSIIIPAYNAASYIGEALDSVFAQTFNDYEIIIVNDGSPDTLELERVLEPYSARIRYLKQENGGPGRARNTGIMEARGQYVAFLDSDDTWLPEYLAKQLKALRDDPTLDLIYTDALVVGVSPFAGRTCMEVDASRGEATFESLLRWDCSVITSCTIARRQTLIEAGLFDPDFYYSEDFDLWLRVAHRGGKLAYQTEVLAHRRSHAASLCADEARQLAGEVSVYEKWLREESLSPEMRALVRRQMEHRRADLALARGKQELLEGRYAQAREDFASAHSFSPTRKLRLTLIGLRFAPQLFRKLYDLREQAFARKYGARKTA